MCKMNSCCNTAVACEHLFDHFSQFHTRHIKQFDFSRSRDQPCLQNMCMIRHCMLYCFGLIWSWPVFCFTFIKTRITWTVWKTKPLATGSIHFCVHVEHTAQGVFGIMPLGPTHGSACYVYTKACWTNGAACCVYTQAYWTNGNMCYVDTKAPYSLWKKKKIPFSFSLV